MPHSPGIGAIFGIVSEDGVAKSGGRLLLLDRSNLTVVAHTVADSDGGYVFNGLNQTTSDYLVLAVDDDGAPAKNALVQDYIQPIPAYSGATFGGNWLLRSLRLNPVSLLLPRFLNSVPLHELGQSAANSSTGALLIDQNSITPGAPQVPALALNSGTVTLGVRARHTSYDGATNTGSIAAAAGVYQASMEIVVDTSQSWQVWMPGRNPGGNGITIMGASWDASSKTLRVSTSGGGIGGGATYPDLTGGVYHTFTYNGSALTAGPHHFVVAATLADSVKAYIDGALAMTGSLSGTNSTLVSSGDAVYQGLSLCGISGALGSATFGPVVYYPTALDTATAAALYNDLMVGSTPAATGYVKDVLIDAPSMMLRLNAASYGTENEFLTQLYPLTHYGTITVQQTSPVTGGAMTHFGGGVMRSEGTCPQVSQNALSIEFFVNPDSATPAAAGIIAAARFNDDSYSIWQVQQLATTGKLRLTVHCSDSSDETINFNYAPAVADALVAIVLDKVAHAALVYENGVLKDTQSTTGTYLLLGANASLQVGGLRSTGGTISAPFNGKVGELAVYGHVLSPDRLLSHYNARTAV